METSSGGGVVLGKENEAGGKASVMRPFVHEVPWSATIRQFSAIRDLFKKGSRPIVSGYWRRLLVPLLRTIKVGTGEEP